MDVFFIALFFHSLDIYKYINKHSKTSSINFYVYTVMKRKD
ncbi:hypothetical protein AF79_04675 [Aliarcobacter butzleri L354]|nr:hypothetical protein AF79_04675 [Aliarcobacter butzleri L354]